MDQLRASEALHVQAHENDAGGGIGRGHQGAPPASPPRAAAALVQRLARRGEPVGERERERLAISQSVGSGEAELSQ
jgi:hypothetical protein